MIYMNINKNAQRSSADEFRMTVRGYLNEELLDGLDRAHRDNKFGSHDDDVSIFRTEILRRMS